MNNRLFLFDGMALAYRAYFAFIARPLINSRGENTSAIYGFVTALMKVLEDERPDHIAVVFDTKEPTFRHKLYPEYKATRQKMPEDMAAQMEKLKDVVRAFNTPLIELPGFEADDIIGTLARQAEKEGVVTYMVTGDKDFLQLISPSIKMYKPGKSGGEPEIVEESGVRQKFGVTPGQVTDVLGLVGDKSDNVPGVPGIGEKTAIPLIQKYGSMEELYNHLDEIPQKGVREKLLSHREQAFLSKHLVTIQTDVPLSIDFRELHAAKRNIPLLARLFGELEFRSLASKLKDTAQPVDIVEDQATSFRPEELQTTNIGSDSHTYHCVANLDTLRELAGKLRKAPLLVLDTETTSENPLEATLIGISVCTEPREAYYVPMRTDLPGAAMPDDMFGTVTQDSARDNHTTAAPERNAVLKELKPILEDPDIRKVGQNIKYDILVLMNHGIEVRGVEFDTMVAGYVLRADGQHSLESLAMEYFGYRMIAFEDLVGKRGKNQKSIIEVPLQAIAEYSAEDADMTMRIYQHQLARLGDTDLLALCNDVEFPLIPVLARMEFAGIALDVDYLASISRDLEHQLESLIEEIYVDAGETFNINSTQQLGDILFKKLNLPPVRKTKTGLSTDVGVLEALKHAHPIIEKLLTYRQLTKLKSTYVDALPELINPGTGRLHTSFNQTVAATGRLAGSDPNLQNIPIRTDIGRAIRKAFVPGSDEMVLMSADYSQIELRVMAHISGDAGLAEAFLNKEDIHASTAAKVFGIPMNEVTREMRRKAKEVNFGIMYGIGPFGLSSRLEISQAEAKDIINRYFERFPKVKQYINDTIDTTRRRGYASTLLGRRRYLPDINSRNRNVRGNAERQAINMPIQGTAADMIKLAMISIDRAIYSQHLESQMLLQVHDELVFEVRKNELERMEQLVCSEMQNALKLSVPIDVEIGSGRNWLEAH